MALRLRILCAALFAMAFAGAAAAQQRLVVPDWVGLSYDHGAGPDGVWWRMANAIAQADDRGLDVDMAPMARLVRAVDLGESTFVILPSGAGAPSHPKSVRSVGTLHKDFRFVVVSRDPITALESLRGHIVSAPLGLGVLPGVSDDPRIALSLTSSEGALDMINSGRVQAAVMLDLDLAHMSAIHGVDIHDFAITIFHAALTAHIYAAEHVMDGRAARLAEIVETLRVNGVFDEILRPYRDALVIPHSHEHEHDGEPLVHSHRSVTN